MKDKEPELLQKFRTTGILTESDMDEAGIIKVNYPNESDKDTRALHQQRAVIMNSPECAAKYRSYKTAKELKQDEAARKKLDTALYNNWFNQLTLPQKTAEKKFQKPSIVARRTVKAAELRNEGYRPLEILGDVN
jgi:hypothetical protein